MLLWELVGWTMKNAWLRTWHMHRFIKWGCYYSIISWCLRLISLHLMDHSLRPFSLPLWMLSLPTFCVFLYSLSTRLWDVFHHRVPVCTRTRCGPGPPAVVSSRPLCLLSWPSSLSFHSLGLCASSFIWTVSFSLVESQEITCMSLFLGVWLEVFGYFPFLDPLFAVSFL